MKKLTSLTISDIHRLLWSKEASATEITRSYLNLIDKLEPTLSSFVTVTEEYALAQAKKADDLIAAGKEPGILSGVPMGIKDNMCTKGIETTCSSNILRGWKPPYTATVVDRLEQAGAVLLGKLNMDEFAMGSSTENSRFFTTRNPWDTDRVPGGSSGGAAAATAAGEVTFTLGTDTGGSIRQPAAYCGLVGMKPTYGRVSRYGVIAFASSLDQVGPLTKTVEDCAIVMQAISGRDPMDSTSADIDVPDYLQSLTGNIKGLRIGIPKEYFVEGIHQDVCTQVRKAIEVLEDLGAVCEEMSLPHTEYALPAYYIVAPAEASTNLARYDGVGFGYRDHDAKDLISMYQNSRSEGFGPEVKRRIMIGTYALSSGYYDAFYLKALKVRTLIKQDFDRAFEKYDAIVAPTTPSVAFKIGEKVSDPLALYQSDLLTVPSNMAGVPSISVPCGFSHGVPVGLQIISKPFAEDLLLRIAHAYEINRGIGPFIPNLEVD